MQTQIPPDRRLHPAAADCWLDPLAHTVRSPSISCYSSSSWSIVLRLHQLVLSDRCMLIPCWLPSREFNWWILFSYSIIPHPMLHGVVLTRCTGLLVVVGSPHASSFTAPLWSHPVSHSETYLTLYREAFLSRDGTSRFYGRGFCLDPWKDKWLWHVCVPAGSAHPLLRSMIASTDPLSPWLHSSFIRACDRRELTSAHIELVAEVSDLLQNNRLDIVSCLHHNS